MRRLLHASLALAASAVMLGACDDGSRAESAAARARESSLARDLAVATENGAANGSAGLDTTAVTESPGMLDSAAADPATDDGAHDVPNATNVSSPSVPSADGYVGPSCASPARDDQQRCLRGYLAKSDVLLDRYYQALILRLKSEAGSTSSKVEPPSVQRLRTAQRAWLVFRDDECRKRTHPTEGPLWAPVRAQCLAEYSAVRARELGDALSRRKVLARREQAAKATTTGARTSTRRTGTKER